MVYNSAWSSAAAASFHLVHAAEDPLDRPLPDRPVDIVRQRRAADDPGPGEDGLDLRLPLRVRKEELKEVAHTLRVDLCLS